MDRVAVTSPTSGEPLTAPPVLGDWEDGCFCVDVDLNRQLNQVARDQYGCRSCGRATYIYFNLQYLLY